MRGRVIAGVVEVAAGLRLKVGMMGDESEDGGDVEDDGDVVDGVEDADDVLVGEGRGTDLAHILSMKSFRWASISDTGR